MKDASLQDTYGMGFVVFRTGSSAVYIPTGRSEQVISPVTPLSSATMETDPKAMIVKTAYRNASGESPKDHREVAQRAQQIMSSPVVSVVSETSVSEARAIFRSRRVRHLPVMSKEGALVGLVSDRDVLAVETTSPHLSISQIMSKNVLTTHGSTCLRNVAMVMVEKRVGALPVIDEDHMVIGIVTTSDLLRCIVNTAPLDLWV